MKRMTAREFRSTFPQLAEPALVGNGIWFPEADSTLLAYAEGMAQGGVLVAAVPKVATTRNAGKDFSKQAQAKGRMGR